MQARCLTSRKDNRLNMYASRFKPITESLDKQYSGSAIVFRVLRCPKRHSWHSWLSFLVLALLFVHMQKPAGAASNRSAYIPYDVSWFGPPDFRTVSFDQVHQQIFTAWTQLDRIDVLSAVDYHLIRSIAVPSPSTLDISPDGGTLAVGTSSAHILFFDTGTFAKTNDIVFPDSALGISAFVYAANGNAFVRAGEGLSTGGGITAYWDHTTNSFSYESNALGTSGIYSYSGPLARSGDYTRILLGSEDGGGSVQFIDGNTGDVLYTFSLFDSYIMGIAANNTANRFALCVQAAGLANILVILDSSYNEIYQDESGCGAMAFSKDGNTLYRDGSANGVASTQSIDMSTFAVRSTQNYFSSQSGSYPTVWQDADNTGMVYGVNSNIPNGGAIFVAIDTTVSSTGNRPPINDPFHIVRVTDNVGSPQGGDLVRILCTGVDNVAASSVSVKLGGALATGVTVTTISSIQNIPNLRIVTAKTPPGTPGVVNVTLTAGTTSDTASGAFQYAQTSKLFPFSTSPNFLLFDSSRQKLYASNKDQVEVIDPIGQRILTPLVPAGGKLASSQFAGLSLSPDSTNLYIADAGANLIHIVDLTNPSNGSNIDPGKALGSPGSISPARVFETSSGELVGSPTNGGVFRIDTSAGSGSWITDIDGLNLGFAWTSTNQGRYVLITTGINGLISGRAGLWDANTAQYTASSNEIGWPVEADANQDGTIITNGGSTPGIQDSYPQFVDFNLDTLGFLEQHFDIGMPTGTPSLFFHPSGALLYKAGVSAVGGSVEIDDVHQWQPAASVTFPEPFVTSYSPATDRMLAIDNTGTYLFGVTNSGITMMVLNTAPLSIGNLQPSFGSPSGGATITIRGSGFQTGATASFGGTKTATTYVDQNTLTTVLPVLPVGWQDVTVSNTSGVSYSAPGMFQVVGAQLTPVISGFSPSPLAISPLAVYPTPVTILGSGFESYDWVEIDGQPVDSSYTDSGHIVATIPWQLLEHLGSIPFTVVSPFNGFSNTLSLSLVNTLPTIHGLWPLTLASGGGQVNFNVYGVNYVSGSQAYWNGQPLATQVSGGSVAGTGDELLIATVPATLLATAGTVTITVVNPVPGGGTSNSVTMDVSPAHPFVVYPSSIDFGTVLLNFPTSQTLQLQNVGSANYTVSSITLSSGPFAVGSQSNCTNTSYSPPYAAYCLVQLQLSPIPGLSNATLTIVDNVPGSPHNIPVSGTGTQTLVPVVTLGSINALGQPVSAQLAGNAVVGGSNVTGIAWIEYGTDPQLSTYSSSPTWPLTGDGGISGIVTGLSPSNTYTARLAVQTPGGVGRSSAGVFATMAAWPEVALSLAQGASNVATIHAGQTATYQLLISDGGNGYTGTAALSCSGAPTGTTCSVAPTSVQVGVSATAITVSVPTTAGSSAFILGAGQMSANRLSNYVLFFVTLLPLVVPLSRRRIRRFAGVFALLAFMTACGGSSSPQGGGGQKTPPTAAGTYYITVNAASSTAQTSYLLTLTVN